MEKLQESFEKAITHQLEDFLKTNQMGPVIMTDGTLPSNEISLERLDEINQLEPFGREFEAPIFDGEFIVEQLKPVGNDGTHLKLTLKACDEFQNSLSCIWFNALSPDAEETPIQEGQRIRAIYTLDKNEYRGSVSIQGKISTAYTLTEN